MDENDVLRQIAESNEASYYGASSYGTNAGGSSGGGWLDQLAAVGTGYLSRRIDVDIQRRMAATGTVQRAGTQRSIFSSPGAGITTPAGGLNMAVVAPLALLGVAALVLLLRR